MSECRYCNECLLSFFPKHTHARKSAKPWNTTDNEISLCSRICSSARQRAHVHELKYIPETMTIVSLLPIPFCLSMVSQLLTGDKIHYQFSHVHDAKSTLAKLQMRYHENKDMTLFLKSSDTCR